MDIENRRVALPVSDYTHVGFRGLRCPSSGLRHVHNSTTGRDARFTRPERAALRRVAPPVHRRWSRSGRSVRARAHAVPEKRRRRLRRAGGEFPTMGTDTVQRYRILGGRRYRYRRIRFWVTGGPTRYYGGKLRTDRPLGGYRPYTGGEDGSSTQGKPIYGIISFCFFFFRKCRRARMRFIDACVRLTFADKRPPRPEKAFLRFPVIPTAAVVVRRSRLRMFRSYRTNFVSDVTPSCLSQGIAWAAPTAKGRI